VYARRMDFSEVLNKRLASFGAWCVVLKHKGVERKSACACVQMIILGLLWPNVA